MTALSKLLWQGDVLSATLVWALMLMSVGSWSVMAYKTWLLLRISVSMQAAKSAYWQAVNEAQGLRVLAELDRCSVLLPLASAHQQLQPNSLGANADLKVQRTRVLRDALHGVLNRLQSGQAFLATVGATAPFVGLLGTVWGIYHALTAMSVAGQISLAQVTGPVGESLIMTAAGLMVALPAVLGFNFLGRLIQRLTSELEGFAQDLRDV